MFGATGSAAPVTRSVDVGTDVGTAEAVATSAASPVPFCADGPSPGRSRRETTAAASSAPASATEGVLFFLDDDVAHPACDSGGRGTTRARHGWRGAVEPMPQTPATHGKILRSTIVMGSSAFRQGQGRWEVRPVVFRQPPSHRRRSPTAVEKT